MIRTVARVFGVAFLLFAIIGSIQTGTEMTADVDRAPRLLGLFPVNLLHNVVHPLFGIWGLAAARTAGAARAYCRGSGIIYVVLMVLGLVSPNGFGPIPLGSHDVWLHAVLGLSLLGAGYAIKDGPVAPGTARA
jgi:hypothetical protein